MSLLGGLLGGLRGGGGGFGGGLRGMMGSRRSSSGGGGSFSSPPTVDKSQPAEPEPQEQPRQTQPEKAQPEPEQQPPEQQAAKQVTAELATPVAQEQAKQVSPIKGLLDEAPVAKAPDTSGTEEQPAAPTVVNRADTMTPVARPADEQTGQVPTTFQTDGVLNQLMDSGGNRQPMEFTEGMASKTPAIEDRSFQFKGPGSVSGALPARRYQSRV